MATAVATTQQTRSAARSDGVRKLMAFAGLLLLVAIFYVIQPQFRTYNAFVSILLATAVNGILALGATYVITTGGIDLSVGTMMTFAAVIGGTIITSMGMPVWLGVLVALGAGALGGLVNGAVIAKMKVPPFIATLGMLYATKGLALIISNLRPIYFQGAPEFSRIAMGSIVGLVFPNFAIPNAVLILFAAAIVAHLILSKTVFGRYTYAIGSNEEATRLSGVNVDNWKIGVYALAGTFAGLGGIVMSSRLNSVQPGLGAGYELDAIAAVVIGGTSLRGGEGGILGTIIGAFVISTLTYGLRLQGVPQEWQMVVTGAIVVTAVYLDILRRRRG